MENNQTALELHSEKQFHESKVKTLIVDEILYCFIVESYSSQWKIGKVIDVKAEEVVLETQIPIEAVNEQDEFDYLLADLEDGVLSQIH